MTPTRPPASVRIHGLSHRYPGADRRALQEVSFEVPAGVRLGLLGPNGAGKSTLMRILCGFLPVQDGGETCKVEVAGLDVRTQSLAVREHVGYLPEHVPLYPELRVAEHLAFRAAIKGVPRRTRRAEIARVAEQTGITEQLQRPIGQLSRGYRQRVGISDALLGSPPLLILDEPTVGLDPNQVLEIRAMLRELGGKQTLVFSSHILAEVEALCDRVVILSQGVVVADEGLHDALRAGHVEARFDAEPDVVAAIVNDAFASLGRPPRAEPSTRALADGTTAVRIDVPEDAESAVVLDAVGRAGARAGVAVLGLAAGRTRLEERFAEVTGARRSA